MMAALAALLVPAGQAEAASKKRKPKSPVITSVTPLKAGVGDTLKIKGRNFRVGKRKNSVGFKRDGAAVVFVKSDISTSRVLYVKVPKRLEKMMRIEGGKPAATRFRLRLLAKRFGKSYTPTKRSPLISPATATTPGAPGGGPGGTPVDPSKPDPRGPKGDCDGDGILNGDDPDDDNDLLPDTLENKIGTDGCSPDTDGDGVQDGYEYQSAIDLNDDDYQSPNASLPYPGKRPYPNPLDPNDAKVDHDGDGLSLAVEQQLWLYTFNPDISKAKPTFLAPLSYSAGEQYSQVKRDPVTGRRVPTLAAAGYSKWQEFLTWAGANGYRQVALKDNGWLGFTAGWHTYDILDVDRNGTVSAGEQFPLDHDGNGWLSDDERDEDADGLSNYDETVGRMQPKYWGGCYTAEPPYAVSYAGTSPTDSDSDGDGVRDGADDQDHDDVPNMMELSRMDASHLNDTEGGVLCKPSKTLPPPEDSHHPDVFGQVQPFHPCMPDRTSRTCPRVIDFGTTYGPDWWSLQ
jgi:hypothetical protein